MMSPLKLYSLLIFSLLCVVSTKSKNSVNIDLNYDKSGNPHILKLVADIVFSNTQILKGDFLISQSSKTFSGSLRLKGVNMGGVSGVYEISHTGMILVKANVSSSVGVNGFVKVEILRKNLNFHQYAIKYQLPNSSENHIEVVYLDNQILVSHHNGHQKNTIAARIGKLEKNFVVQISGRVGNEKVRGKYLINEDYLVFMDGKLELKGLNPWSFKVNTKRFPFHVDISPASMTGISIINDGTSDMSDVLFFEADYQPDTYLYFISNYKYLTGFKIDRMNQNWVRFEWNNTELFQADISSSPYLFILPSGNEVKLKSRKPIDLLNTKVKTSLDLVMEMAMTLSLEWDITNPLDKIKVLIKSSLP